MVYRREWLTPKEVIDNLREKMKLPLDWDEKSEAHEIKKTKKDKR